GGPARGPGDGQGRLGAGRGGGGGEETREELLPRDAGRPRVGREGRQHLDERPERHRRRGPAAAPAPPGGGAGGGRNGGVDERRLADARLAGDEHQTPVAGGRVGQVPA